MGLMDTDAGMQGSQYYEATQQMQANLSDHHSELYNSAI